ncbi:hypothetical protein QQS21_004507 [Conoideocrella luteorostrata]|uniref:Polyketide synthase n=1 Tax=Conoideocrella luteorostrata TaxID=1105319 RepID=A0AAJ0CRB3_9HYPO|nr:hypothetical protein QQS21_004507 [Conoideocrella luteorostrata]
MSVKCDPAGPIAIIGMGMRLPGGISTADDFWNLLIEKKDGRCLVPSDRYNADAFYGNKTRRQNIATNYGYFLDTNIKGFDKSFFGVKRAEVDVTDPQLRLLLEVVWECMENAGKTNLRGTNTGVFVGVFGEDWHSMLHQDKLMPKTYRVLSAGDYALANMLSWEYDLSGPSMTLRTACSSSLSALHIACQSLQNGDCTTAIVAGSSIIIDPTMTMDMSEAGVLSHTGSCKTFDAAADGFARGEAVNAILLKPLDDALRDGDPIRAVIRSTAVNSDGRTSHIGSPSSESQITLIRRAYERAGIEDFSQTPFIECHGTGTIRGDPIEAEAVATVFGEHGAYIGSVKPNVGHSEGAAALTSIIKAVLSLENETIPPNINFTTPNPKIPFKKYKLEVPVEAIPWPKNRYARISVSSFGFGGANGHAILDSAASFGICGNANGPAMAIGGQRRQGVAPSSDEQSDTCTENDATSIETSDEESSKWIKIDSEATARQSVSEKPINIVRDDVSPVRSVQPFPLLLPISTASEPSLKRRVEDLQQYIKCRPESLCDVAYTLGLKRAHLRHRTFCIARPGGGSELNVESFRKTSGKSVNDITAAFVFTGQGANWAGMGKSLVQSSATFLNDIRAMDHALQQLTHPPSWTIEASLRCSGESMNETFSKAEFAQPLCTAIQVALVNFLATCGITPSAVIGHSSGEIAAAYTAGALTMSEAIICAYLRGFATKSQSRSGGMAAVGMSKDAVMPYLIDGVQLACENSPRSVTISGDLNAIDKTLEEISTKDPEIFTRKLNVNIAYHSDHMSEIGSAYEKMLAWHLSPRYPHCPFYSTVSGTIVTEESLLAPAYWRSNLESPVQFYAGMKQLLHDFPNVTALLEVGPHSALRGPLRQIFQTQKNSKQSPDYVPTLLRGKDSATSVLETIGQLYLRGYAVDFSTICPKASLLTNMPTYPWDRDLEHWRESRLSYGWRQRKHVHHEILGSRCVETTGSEPMWRNVLHQYDVSWLPDHKVEMDVVFPVAGFVAMMGEAIRQVTGSDAYQLRNLMVKSALLMSELEPIEIVTSMRPLRLTGLTNSSTWYEISISTFNELSWVEVCVAQGKAKEVEGSSTTRLTRTIGRRLREVPDQYFYDRMQQIGLRYGPHFQRLSDISSDTEAFVAAASLQHDESTYEATYSVHPTVIDCCIQLGVVANCRGLAREVDGLALPVAIDSISVRPAGSDLIVEATVDHVAKTASAVAVTKESNQLVVTIENGRCMPFNTGDNASNKDVLHASRVQWLPDICSKYPQDLIERDQNLRQKSILSERCTIACILQMSDILDSLQISPSGHLEKYLSWLKKEKADILQGNRSNIAPEALVWASMSLSNRQQVLESNFAEVHAMNDPKASSIARLVHKLTQGENLELIFTGAMHPLVLLLEDNGLRNFYEYINVAVNIDRFIYLSGHCNPTMKILEIGAGTGAATEKVLKSLVSESGVRMYSQYIFTDLSSSFFASAEERFADWDAVEFKVLDIEKDLVEQGFEQGSFDLIVASNVLHATSSLHDSLKNVRSLFRTGGRLYLQELVSPINWRNINLLTGLLPGWWTGDDDGRLETPCVSPERWDRELRDAGFSGADTVLLDDDPPYSICANILSTAQTVVTDDARTIVFLYKEEKHEFACSLASMLERQDIRIKWVRLGNEADYVSGFDVVSTIDLEKPYISEMSKQDYAVFTAYLSSLKGGLLWLTRAAQVGCTDPQYGIGIGLMRTVRVELGIDLWTAELDHLDSPALLATVAIYQKFHNRGRNGIDRKVDVEYAVQDGVTYIGRYHWTSINKELVSQSSHDPKQLIIDKFGLIDSTNWIQHRQSILQDDEVEVQIHYIGLNFRDVMTAMGILPDGKDSLGLEGSGVVTRVGAAVETVNVGDHVCMLGRGLFATRKVVSAKHVIPVPDYLSLEEAASLPVVYATAVYTIMHLGQLAKGQTILIHSAAGGVGQAAIHISQTLGAEIYVTVGTEEKVEYLITRHNIPRERIFNSHNNSFLDGVMQATENRGVDMVLNSLSGDLLHTSWKCVAKNGKMIEIGKRDMLEHGHLALDLFQSNRTFYGVDILSLWQETPDKLMKILNQLLQMNVEGILKPIQPIHVFPVENRSEAFRYMKKGQHIGKIVLKIPEDPAQIPVTMSHALNLLSDSSTYLMIGGLGGLGKHVTRWMVEKGARNFCFLSRSSSYFGAHHQFFLELESQGCQVAAIAGSVTDMDDVHKAIHASPTPIAGVLQMSMVIKDSAFRQMGYDDWRAVLDPKVKGTWNLHKALSGIELDFFILFASIVGLVGQPGQANYSSANSFLDSFVQYRHGLGLPCSVIDLGAMEGIGFLTTRPDKLIQYRSSGLLLLQERQLMEAIQIAMKRSSPSNGFGPVGPRQALTSMSQLALGMKSTKAISDPRNTRLFTGDIRCSMYVNMNPLDRLDSSIKDEEIKIFLKEVEADPSILNEPEALPRISWEIGRTLFKFLALPEEDLGITLTLESIGVDSLASIEIRNWWRRTIGLEITVLEILNAETIEGLGKRAISSLKEKYKVKSDAEQAEATV